ncbi:hypothetical protein KR038_000555 [Drosophila bunnanda]|nr:hypothetical protein KR038_000555 [Drosophila bunnanda]
MTKLGVVCLLVASLCVALAWAEPRPQSLQGRQQLQKGLQQHPYIFLTVPKGRANAGTVVQGFEIVEEVDEADLEQDQDHDDDVHNDENDVEHDDDDDDEDQDDEEELEHQLGLNFARSGLGHRRQQLEEDDAEQDDDQEQQHQQLLPKKTQMMVARDQAGAIMVPDGIIEIEGQSVLDEKTGKAALLVPRAALDAIPDGAVVALMERSASGHSGSDEVEEERANRVVVRRRKNNGRRNIRRRGTNVRRRRRPVQRRRRGGNRGGNRRRNVRVIRPGGGNRRRGGNQRRRGQVVYQG